MRRTLAALLALFVFLAGCSNSRREKGGCMPAPDFTLKGLDGKPVSLSDFRGKTVFLDFWATWCPPCKEEMPSMARLYRMMGDQGLEILAITEDADSEDVAEFVELHDVPFRVLIDQRRKVYDLYGVRSLPTAFLIDGDGIIRAHKMGAFDWTNPSVLQALTAIADERATKHTRLLEPGTITLSP